MPMARTRTIPVTIPIDSPSRTAATPLSTNGGRRASGLSGERAFSGARPPLEKEKGLLGLRASPRRPIPVVHVGHDQPAPLAPFSQSQRGLSDVGLLFLPR